MAFHVLVIFLCSTILGVSSLWEHDPCNLTDGSPGNCTVLNRCQSVLDELMAGNLPDTVCGYKGSDPLVCCPTNTPITTTTPFPSTTPKSDGNCTTAGSIARQKCAEYAQSVYVWRYPPIPDSEPIQISQCAINSQKLIVGGTKAERKEFPHMAAIGYNRSNGIDWLCGGTLISDKFVLTAAHCTSQREGGHAAWARLGDLNLVRTDDMAKPVNHRIIERIRHPDYNPPAQYHDIALFRLESTVTFNDWIRPACLHTEFSTGTENAVGTGWGHIEWLADGGSNDLLKVSLPLIDQSTCWRSYRPGRNPHLPNGINETLSICAGELDRDACQGDSGGPLAIFSNWDCFYCMYNVVGVTSLGQGCGLGIPGVYTRVSNYIPWIENTVWGNSV